MIIAAVLAGGKGSRMGNTETPKQYMMLGSRPIIVHTVEKFFVNPDVDKVVVLCPDVWVKQTKDLINKYIGDTDKISVISGGASRNDTLMCAIDFVETNYGLDDDTILLTHDAVRPFVTHRIINDNIEAVRKHGACDTVWGATDTIVESVDGEFISNIPERKNMYQGQTPQSFKAKRLKEICNSLTEAEKEILTDACKIYTLKGEPVSLVKGEVFNIKITYPYDLKMAGILLEGVKADD